MALTVEQIHSAENDDLLLELLAAEIDRLIPKAYHDDRDRYHRRVEVLPSGLRAMAGIQFFNVSMAMDDLAWHFGNQNDERDLQETLNGLRELDLGAIAEQFEWAWEFMKPYLPELASGLCGSKFPDGRTFAQWLDEIGAREFMEPMNQIIWHYCEEHPRHRLLSSWPTYARKHPERCVVSES